MKEPFFNDISTTPLCVTDDEVEARINEFVGILEFCGFLGFKKVRFDKQASQLELKAGYFVKDYLAEHAKGNGNRALLILNMFQSPYIDEDSLAFNEYLLHTARLKGGGGEVEADGLASAFFSRGFAVGFASEDYWKDNVIFTLSITEDATKKSRDHKVFCISRISHFRDDAFIKWAVDELPLQFRSSNLSTEAKRVKLRDDHGKDILSEFSERIKKEPYIIEIINSLPFKPKEKRMTKIKDDGIIEVRLLNTDNKIGIVVRTTAHSEMEAIYLAASIEKKFT